MNDLTLMYRSTPKQVMRARLCNLEGSIVTQSGKDAIVENHIGDLYSAPELQADGQKNVGPCADAWSIGVILYEMTTGERPFESKDKAGKERASFANPYFKTESGESCKDLIDKLLQKKVEDRLSVTEALNHAFLRKEEPKTKSETSGDETAIKDELPQPSAAKRFDESLSR